MIFLVTKTPKTKVHSHKIILNAMKKWKVKNTEKNEQNFLTIVEMKINS